MPTVKRLEPKHYWRVTCRCGFGRDATSVGEAQAFSRLHLDFLHGAREQNHGRANTTPQRDEPGGNPLPLL